MTPQVLVVDDDAGFAELAAVLLTGDGRVTVVGRAADGPEAFDLALAHEPDIVLMNLDLPGYDGIEATRRILRELPDTRVVVITSSASPEDRRLAREAGAEAYLQKSLAPEALVEAVLTVAR
jgi:DNA-binding NarL/FixJ family response regulator